MALKENYRELLIDAVVRVAAREGLDRTTTKLIAAEVPCNEVYIYRNFGSKDALLQAAFSRTDLRFVQTVLKNLDVMDAPGQPLEQRCRALWEPVWRFCLAQPDDIRFYLRYYYSAQVPCQRPRAAPPQLPAASGPPQPLLHLLARQLAADGAYI